jgi:LacI family transcriptional regulator
MVNGTYPTVRDVAEDAAVSVGTVSRVANGHPAVRAEVRERVVRSMERLGWRPNAIARSMRTATTRVIGSLFADVRNPLYAAIIKSAEEHLSAAGYTLVVANSDGSVEREAAILRLFAQRRVDGMLLCVSDDRDRSLQEAAAEAGVPVVLVERDMPDTDAVHTDHAGGVRSAAAHLISLGHRRIGLITGGPGNRTGREKVRGFLRAFAEAGLPEDGALVRAESLSLDYAFSQTQRLLDLPSPPTAIIAGGNLMLAGVLRAVRLRELRVPEDLSLVSTGDTELAELATPPVTVVRWDLSAVGRHAAELLLSRLSGEAPTLPRRVQIPTEVVLRASCASPKHHGNGSF